MSQFGNFHPRLFDTSKLKKREDDSSTSSTDSWVELPPPSRASSCNSDMSVLDQDSVKDGPRLVTPSTMATLGNALENLKMLPQNKGDWILDWSSHPEARESLIQCTPNQSTPPNSPIPGDMNFVGIFSCGCNTENDYPLFVGFIITHVISFFIGLTAGFYICKRMMAVV